MSRYANAPIRFCQEDGCEAPAYGPRAKRCLECHRRVKKGRWERQNDDPRIKAIRRSYWAARKQEQRERVLPVVRHVHGALTRMMADPTTIDTGELRRLGAVLIQVYTARRPTRKHSSAGAELEKIDEQRAA